MQRALLEKQTHDLTPDELVRLVRAVEPRALLAAPRVVRRVILQEYQQSGLGLFVPHRKSHVIQGSRLDELTEREELGLLPADDLPQRVLLLVKPGQDNFELRSDTRWLNKYWRLLFHGRIHLDLEERIAQGRLDEQVARKRIAELGPVAFDEAQLVLRQEGYLPRESTTLAAYVEFASVYAELNCFAPRLIPKYFPALQEADHVLAVLGQDLDIPAIFAATRLPQARLFNVVPHLERKAEVLLPLPSALESEPGKHSERLAKLAAKASGKGNQVRAARLYWQAANKVRGTGGDAFRQLALAEVKQIVGRLREPLGFSAEEAVQWEEALGSLLPRAAHGFWTRETRLLFDLQKLCQDSVQAIYSVDIWRWLGSGFRQPLKRPLQGLGVVRTCQHLKHVQVQLRECEGLSEAAERLHHLLEPAIELASQRVRERFREKLQQVFSKVGYVTRSLAEKVAIDKIVEELLDQLVDRGFFAMSDVRDAVSRNQYKLNDLEDASQFFLGDQLLRADREFAEQLPGIYQRGEAYLRWPQAFSALAFGTPLGRWLVKYVAIPFGGAFVALEGINHFLESVFGLFGLHSYHIPTVASTWVLGFFLLNVIYQDGFRRFLLDSVRLPWQGLKFLIWEMPAIITKLPLVQRVLQHPLVQASIPALQSLGQHLRNAWRIVIKPALVTYAIWLFTHGFAMFAPLPPGSPSVEEQTPAAAPAATQSGPAALPAQTRKFDAASSLSVDRGQFLERRASVPLTLALYQSAGSAADADQPEPLTLLPSSKLHPPSSPQGVDNARLLRTEQPRLVSSPIPASSSNSVSTAAKTDSGMHLPEIADAKNQKSGPPEPWLTPIHACLATFFALSLLFNSGFGRDLGELATEWLAQRWKDFRVHFVAGLVQATLDFFSQVVDALDRLLYSVDEILRFRGGQGPLNLIAKAALGGIWSVVRYFIRIYVTLLVEPQVNPVKHFPVVTVAHKLMVPFYPQITTGMMVPLLWFFGTALGFSEAWSQVFAYTIYGPTLILLPGVFGFLVWELKENWRLFEANRSPQLLPAPIGSHGETMVGLLRPGIHSGTIPSLYARLRRAERRVWKSDELRRVHRLEHRLQHVREDVVRFIERDLLAMLHGCRAWGERHLRVEEVQLYPNRVAVSISADGLNQRSAQLEWWEDSGLLFAQVAEAGWLRDISASQQRLFAAALLGVYKLSGVDIVQEQLEAKLGYEPAMANVHEQELWIYQRQPEAPPIRYTLNTGPLLEQKQLAGQPQVKGPDLEKSSILLSSRQVYWPKWREAWEEADEPLVFGGLAGGWKVLPANAA